MERYILTFTVIGWAMALSAASLAQSAQVPPRCLHGPSEPSDQRVRREQALRVAQAINSAENLGPQITPGKPRTYKPLGQLADLPQVPDGFSVQLNTDGLTETVPRSSEALQGDLLWPFPLEV
jgi:hypothetical protein